MALTFFVEDVNHRRVRAVPDDSSNSFLTVCRRLAQSGSRVFDVIDPYADAMLNFIQLERLLAELGPLLDGGDLAPAEASVAREVLAAAKEAREISGYLFVEGD